ncbi:hypothetical protein [Celerinatantimonas sp. YJH-8]|uniref:hypothetical protein n=1 Tax=Celerinatantimonas sp. YJH-8 TaxID=3228714 RepID=UPI0038C1877E
MTILILLPRHPLRYSRATRVYPVYPANRSPDAISWNPGLFGTMTIFSSVAPASAALQPGYPCISRISRVSRKRSPDGIAWNPGLFGHRDHFLTLWLRLPKRRILSPYAP